MSADSLEIRVVKIESDIRRIDSVSEPRFERIEAALAKLTDLAERQDARLTNVESTIKVLQATCATKEDLQRMSADMHKSIADVHKEISIQGSRYTGWLLAVGAWMFIVSGMAVAAIRYLLPNH